MLKKNSNIKFLLKNKKENKYLGLRKLFFKSKLNSLQHIQSVDRTGEVIAFNFNKNSRRLNTLDSFDLTGTLAVRPQGRYLNASLLLKYIFKAMGGALISKPIFIFNQNKITIKLFYFLSKNIYFFNTIVAYWQYTVHKNF